MAKRKKAKREVEWNNEHKCAKCGKTFLAAPEHVFKKNHKWYCKWTCYKHRNDPEEQNEEEDDE